MREAVWEPFIGFLSRHRALEILAFVLLYKLADQLTQALTRPFLIDMGYNADQRGIALATFGLIATIGGSFVGGWITTIIGLGHSLWLFGILQTSANFGYVLVAWAGAPNLALMYGAISFEMLMAGMGTGAFSVLLLRITQKRFSATQYALFSSVFALPRVISGSIAGFAVDSLGWSSFFLCAIALGVPGLVMLARFVPIGVREPEFTVEEARVSGPRPSIASLVIRGVAGGVIIAVGSLGVMALLDALKTMRETRTALDLRPALWRVWHPTDIAGWLQLVAIGGCAVIGGLFVAAAIAARHGAGGTIPADAAAPALSDS